MQQIKVQALAFTAVDGHALAGYRFDPERAPRAVVVIAPAMAIYQKFYAEFARWLAGQGFAVRTFDYRGTGESLRGGKRGAPGDLSDWCLRDYEGVLRAAHAEFEQLPLFAVGHSFGGQCAPLLPSRELLNGLVNIAVGSGSMRHNTPPTRRLAPLLWYFLVPVLCPLFGYFPGTSVGVIGDLPSGAVRQWRRWCLTPDYILSGEPGAREAYASARYPVLALTFSDDELLLESGSQLIHGAYTPGRVDYRLVQPQDFDQQRIGHVGFFRSLGQDRLWPLVRDWLDGHLDSVPGSLTSG